jgi:hypothetical protein
MTVPPQRLPNPVVLAEQKAECYRLKLRGHTIRQIADELAVSHPEWDLSRSTVQRRIQDECTERVNPLVEELRQQQVDRLESYIQALHEQIDKGGRGLPRVIEVAIKTDERLAKLLGLDAPQQVETTVTGPEDVELAELIAEQKARNAVTEQAIRGER